MTTDTPRTDAARFEALRSSALRQDCIPLKLGQELERELAASQAEVAELKQGKVFVDPKWVYDLETQLAHSLSNQLKTQAEVERLKEEARVGNIALDNLRGEVDLWFNRFREAARQLDSLNPQA
jgi:hypothetical protein